MDTHVNSEEENISEVGAYAYEAHNFKRSKLKRTNIESLTDDVLFDILTRVPAPDIYYAGSLVCHKWYQTIRTHDFVHAHLPKSTCGLLILDNGSKSNKQRLFATQKGRIIEKSNFVYKFTGDAFFSCNGLVLERQNYKKSKLVFRITNPTTNQHMDLPSFPRHTMFYNSAIAFALASKEYKVIRSFFCLKSGKLECAILTVGVDKNWKRRVDIRHLSPTAKKLLGIFPLSTDGFVHWAQNGSSRDFEFVLTLNVETEIFSQFRVPPNLCGCDGGETKLLYRYLPMGSHLSLLIARDNEFPIYDQVWVMKPETGEWTKMMNIDSESQKRAFEGVPTLENTFYPVGWLKFREVLVFRTPNLPSVPGYVRTDDENGFCIAYNVRTHEIEPFDLGFSPHRFIVHKNSLVWLDGC